MKIKYIRARQIYDSRGYPTVECDVILHGGSIGRAAVPSGTSTGSAEALELRDGGDRYGGKGVSRALSNIKDQITPALTGLDASDQTLIDKTLCDLDGTDNKGSLGANATLACSLAAAKAAANSQYRPLYQHIGDLAGNTKYTLPTPMLNVINGGKHARGSTDIQEFMIVPAKDKGFLESLEMASNVFHALAQILSEKGYSTAVGDEGGYAPDLSGGTEEALGLIEQAVQKSGYRLGIEVSLALDVAASELRHDNNYSFAQESRQFTSDELISWYEQLLAQHPIVSLEDGLAENDWPGWQKLNATLGNKVQIVSDDLTVTNTELLKKAIREKAANAILIKPNQIGTLTETINAVQMAKQAGWRTIISHRSGETEDTTIAHLAVGLDAGQIKTGSFSRSERVAKFNELIRIWQDIARTN